MPQLHETRIGQQFLEGTMPRIAKALEKIADNLAPQDVKPRKSTLVEKSVPPEMQRNKELLALLRTIHIRIHQQEIAGHFPESVISTLEGLVGE